MLKKLNEAGKKTGIRINRTKTHFMKNLWCEGGQTDLMVLLSRTTPHAYLGHSMNMAKKKNKAEEGEQHEPHPGFSTKPPIG
ncbi:hypothetical protein KIN20_002081 [Parelaphostrongylus tenuis]|uniref:Uncharacterized protein n=1 Tax=Parelaphostrongylus tenuis TaxID=148309 RepID=A0AAD5MG31_PARTN|nr:hypothetical protein KIN20_002081 [Parelaphostrongylus tenuis]